MGTSSPVRRIVEIPIETPIKVEPKRIEVPEPVKQAELVPIRRAWKI
jgi:hypothetical protein